MTKELEELNGSFTPPSLEDKIDFLYEVAVKADKLMKDVGPQLIPMLEGIQKNPMLKMFLK